MWLMCVCAFVCLPLAHRTHANITSRMRYMHTSYLAGRGSRSPRTLIWTRSKVLQPTITPVYNVHIHVPRAEGFNCRAFAALEIGYKQKPHALVNVWICSASDL